MGHPPVIEQAYPQTQSVTPSIYVPPIQGRMEQRELDLLINTIASQLKAQQASSLEAALRILDPAGAFGRVLNMRDNERDGEYMDFVHNSLWMQVTTAVDDALHRFVNSGGEDPKGSANESIVTGTTHAETHSNEGGEDPNPIKKPSKSPPPSLNPNTATNDGSNPTQESVPLAEIEPGGKIKPAATLEVGGAVPNPLTRWGAKMNKNVSFKITPTTDTMR
jgi:hypothetical protein